MHVSWKWNTTLCSPLENTTKRRQKIQELAAEFVCVGRKWEEKDEREKNWKK